MLHLEVGGLVVTLAGDGAPLLANAVGLDRRGRIPMRPCRWDPRPRPLRGGPPAVAELSGWLDPVESRPDAADLLASRLEVGASARGRRGIAALVGAIRATDGRTAARASADLLGLGPGLTPEGDDVLVGAAVTLAAVGPAAGLRAAQVRRLCAGLCPSDAARRTPILSATLVRLAAAGAGPEPLARLLSADPRARADLASLGRSSGAALNAAAIATTCVLSGLARR